MCRIHLVFAIFKNSVPPLCGIDGIFLLESNLSLFSPVFSSSPSLTFVQFIPISKSNAFVNTSISLLRACLYHYTPFAFVCPHSSVSSKSGVSIFARLFHQSIGDLTCLALITSLSVLFKTAASLFIIHHVLLPYSMTRLTRLHCVA